MRIRQYKPQELMWWRDLALKKLLFPVIYRKKSDFRVLDEPWDNLIILDACRYDAFSKLIKAKRFGGTLQSRISPATQTFDYLLLNFEGKKCDDIVYVTANPHVDRLVRKVFHKVVSVWQSDWEDSLGTVPPEAVAKRALETSKIFPNKRLIIHFMQPHYPYLDPKLIHSKGVGRFTLGLGTYPGTDGTLYEDFNRFGVRRLRMAYLTGLGRVLNVIDSLLEGLVGRTVISSDHGEAFGELLAKFVPIRVIEHPPGVRIRALVEVPWYTVEKIRNHPRDMSVKATDENQKQVTELDDFLVERRLRDLGYV